MYFPCLFLYNVPCCFYFVIRLCYKSTLVLLLCFFYKFSENFTTINIMCFCFWIIALLSEGIETSFLFERYFYSLLMKLFFLISNFHHVGTVVFFLFKPPMKMEQMECSTTLAQKIQTLGSHPKERIFCSYSCLSYSGILLEN